MTDCFCSRRYKFGLIGLAWGLTLAMGGAWPTASAEAWEQSPELLLDPVVVTGKIDGEPRHKATATIKVIDEESIAESHAQSMTDLLAEHSVGFLSEWTPGQTSINMRGGASDGQGKDFKGQVMVLINGRRAGTANISKLSPTDVARVEIMKGPASVMYGSQAIGGIINIILKNGRNTQGGLARMEIGSSGLAQTHVEHAHEWGPEGSIATYISGSWSRKGDYEGGRGAGSQENTQWKRYGGMGDVDWRINENHGLEFTLRSDGVYDVGFRGSGANKYAKDDRSNRSLDLTWDFESADLPLKWDAHAYLIQDEDYFKWASPRATPGTSRDYNRRELAVGGFKFQPRLKPFEGNEILLGVDLERSRLRSSRDRIDLAGRPLPTNPQDLNQTENNIGLYLEDTQLLLDERLTLRAGLRHTKGETKVDDTPNLAAQLLSSAKYKQTTWSAGLNFEVMDWLSVRTGAATGFRAPTATEMTGSVSFLNTPGRVTYGNGAIKPETNQQYEVGLFAHGQGWFADLALFHNTIEGRIISREINANRDSMYFNNDGDVVVTGLEMDSRVDIDELINLGSWRLAAGLSGSYNFRLEDEARKAANRNSFEVDRMYKYQGAAYIRFGQRPETGLPWLVRLTGVLRGPIYYDTEEGLRMPAYEPNNQFIHRKQPFMVWNMNGELELSRRWTAYAGLNNIFNKNQHPLFIAIDDGRSYLSNPNDGGNGTSMPGREFYLGLKYSF
ncbi:MAG: TonB-dependent receptor [Candidatus Adiutrix sp.]|nr:TonB-dependent receptor [Candidatus Adiutrix sp.]